MFYKDISKSFLKNSLGVYNLQLGSQSQKLGKSIIAYQGRNTQGKLLQNIQQFAFSSTVNIIDNKNPHVNSTSDIIDIQWQKVNTHKSIFGIIKKFKIPTKIDENKHFYQQQQKLYIAIAKLKEEEMTDQLFEIFVTLHNSAIMNIAKIKAPTQYKNDFTFNMFCLALFKGQKILREKNIPISFRVQSDITLMKALLLDKQPISSFMSEIIPHLTLEELKECCNFLVQANLSDFVMRIINTPAQYLKEEYKKELQIEFFSIIKPEKFRSLNFLKQFFDFNLQIMLSKGQQVNEVEIEKAKVKCLQTIDVFLKYINDQKNINNQNIKIKQMFQLIQMSKLTIKKDQIFQFDRLFQKFEDNSKTQQEIIFEIFDQLQLLSFEESEKEQIQGFLITKKNIAGDILTNTHLSGDLAVKESTIQNLCHQLSQAGNISKIQEHQAFYTLQGLIKNSVNITQIITILMGVYKSNKEVAKLLVTQDVQSLINDNVIFLPHNAFSLLIALNNRIVSTPFNIMLQYAKKNHLQFSPLLLTQTLYMIGNSNENNNRESEEFKTIIIKEIINIKGKLGFEEVNLLLKCIQFLKQDQEVFTLQDIIEEISQKKVDEDSRYANVFFNLVQHKILKQGMQAKYSLQQFEKLIQLLQSEKLKLKELDLFNFALLIQASNKYTEADELINFFLARVKIQQGKPRSDQLAYIYISILESWLITQNNGKYQFIINIQNSNYFIKKTKEWKQIIAQYEKWIIETMSEKNSKYQIKLNQLTKVMHSLSKVYHVLDDNRKKFFDEIYDKTLSSYKIQDDLGLSIWILWQQSLICKDINKFQELFKRIRKNIDQVIVFQSDIGKKETVQFKQYKRNMIEQVQEIQVVQLYQSLLYYETNSSLFQQNNELHEEIYKLKTQMDKSQSITNFQKFQTVKHSSNAELHITYVIRQALKHLNLNYGVQDEKKLENIFFVDFFIEELKLVIEVHGKQHYINNTLFLSEISRNNYLSSKGYNIEIISTSEWSKLTQQDQLQKIVSILQKYIK